MGKVQSFQQMVLWKLVIYMEKNEGGPLPNTINKIKSKWLKDLNVKLLNL